MPASTPFHVNQANTKCSSIPSLKFRDIIILVAKWRDYMHTQLYQYDHRSLVCRTVRQLRQWLRRNKSDTYLCSVGYPEFDPLLDTLILTQAFSTLTAIKPFTVSEERNQPHLHDIRQWELFKTYHFDITALSVDILRPIRNPNHITCDIDCPNILPSTPFERIVYLLYIGKLSFPNGPTKKASMLQSEWPTFSRSHHHSVRVAHAVQVIVRAWSMFARIFAFDSIEMLTRPYILLNRQCNLFRVLTADDGFAPCMHSRFFQFHDSPTSNIQQTFPEVRQRSPQLHNMLRQISKIFLDDLAAYILSDSLFKPDFSQWQGQFFTLPSKITILPCRFDAHMQIITRMKEILGCGTLHPIPLVLRPSSDHISEGPSSPPNASVLPATSKNVDKRYVRNSPRSSGATKMQDGIVLPSSAQPSPLEITVGKSAHLITPEQVLACATKIHNNHSSCSQEDGSRSGSTPSSSGSNFDRDVENVSPYKLKKRRSSTCAPFLSVQRSMTNVKRPRVGHHHRSHEGSQTRHRKSDSSPGNISYQEYPQVGTESNSRVPQTNQKRDEAGLNFAEVDSGCLNKQIVRNSSYQQTNRNTLKTWRSSITSEQEKKSSPGIKRNTREVLLTIRSPPPPGHPYTLPPISIPPLCILKFLSILWCWPTLVNEYAHRPTHLWPANVIERFVDSDMEALLATECLACNVFIAPSKNSSGTLGVFARKSFATGDMICDYYGVIAYEYRRKGGSGVGVSVGADELALFASTSKNFGIGLPSLVTHWELEDGVVASRAYVVPFNGCVASRIVHVNTVEGGSNGGTLNFSDALNARCARRRTGCGIRRLHELSETNAVTVVASRCIAEGEEICMMLNRYQDGSQIENQNGPAATISMDDDTDKETRNREMLNVESK